jgi:hypothetical protein
MLGNSSTALNGCISQLINLMKPESILELGCGQGKFGELVKVNFNNAMKLKAVQKIFSADEQTFLNGKGYAEIIDSDIMAYYREGFDDHYNLIVALDVIEHFLYSDVISIINFSLYRADYMLLVWPSAHPQSAVTNPFDRHRSSFEFEVVFYSQTGFAQMNFMHRYHIALLRGFMNANVFPPFI